MKRIILFLLIFISACSSITTTPQDKETKIVLAKVQESEEYILDNNTIFQLTAEHVQNNIADIDVEMFGYNAQIPGPLLHVKQGATLWINFTNNINTPTTIHWHGIRLENPYDGVPMLTQNEIIAGETFLYKLTFPDSGVYWYHPHMREDYQQELGLYGNILVDPTEENYYSYVSEERTIILDDILLTKEGIEKFDMNAITYALMGRFGNVFLINGKTKYNFSVDKGDVVRFFITNAANTRVFNFSIENATIKRIGGDSGAYEREEFVDSVVIAPGERYIVDVAFQKLGMYTLINSNPYKKYILGTVEVKETKSGVTTETEATTDSKEFEIAKQNPYATTELEAFKAFVTKDSDITLELEAFLQETKIEHTMSMMNVMDTTNINEGNDLEDTKNEDIEWEDTNAAMNSSITNETITWIIKDKATGKKNEDIQYQWKVGDKVKIRIYNNKNTMHPMQHPIHLHGQRFVVIATNDIPNDNLVWKDTVLVAAGSYVDIVVDVTNPGKWMGHCHMAEHLQSGMMFMYNVVE